MRALEIVLALLALLIFSVGMCFISIGIKLSSPGPVFYRRSFYDEKGNLEMKRWCFRTMRLPDKAEGEESGSRTNFGRMLRHGRLDEIPVLFSILSGSTPIVKLIAHKKPFFYKVISAKIGSNIAMSFWIACFVAGYNFISDKPHALVTGVLLISLSVYFIDTILVVYRYRKRIFGTSAQELEEVAQYLITQKRKDDGDDGGKDSMLYPDEVEIKLASQQLDTPGKLA